MVQHDGGVPSLDAAVAKQGDVRAFAATDYRAIACDNQIAPRSEAGLDPDPGFQQEHLREADRREPIRQVGK